MTESDLIIQTSDMLKLVGAILLAMPVAWNRERHSRLAGLRTFPLVAMGACAFTMIGAAAAHGDGDAMARIVAGVLTGIGFVGGGAILKSEGKVEGTASAAAIWATGGLGTAVGLGMWDIAIAVSVLTFVLIWGLSLIKQNVDLD